jgi:putative membrane protein
MSQLTDAALAGWTFPWWTGLLLLLTSALYLRGFMRVHRQMPARFPLSGLALYLAGVVTLALALASPLVALDDRLLLTHMVQHLLLLMIAPPLLLLGAPQIPIVRAIPPVLAKRTVGLIAKSRAARRLLAGATHPVTGLTLFSAVMLGWHLPGPFQAALHSDNWHIIEHGCMIAAGLLFWYPVIRPWPAAERWSGWALVPYLLVADGANSVVAAFMVFFGSPAISVIRWPAADRRDFGYQRSDYRGSNHVGSRLDPVSAHTDGYRDPCTQATHTNSARSQRLHTRYGPGRY